MSGRGCAISQYKVMKIKRLFSSDFGIKPIVCGAQIALLALPEAYVKGPAFNGSSGSVINLNGFCR